MADQQDDLSPDIQENEDGSAEVTIPDDVSDIEEMPDGSAVIEIEETMASDEEDFNDNLAEYIDKQERLQIAMW